MLRWFFFLYQETDISSLTDIWIGNTTNQKKLSVIDLEDRVTFIICCSQNENATWDVYISQPLQMSSTLPRWGAVNFRG